MQPLITVIVPVYKVEKYLDKCVESIVNQTYENLEIILVDDGSPDNCPQMCDNWAEKDNRIKVVHKANGGLSSARNAGIDVMNGKYVSFIDSDDYIELTMIEIMYSNIIKDDYDVCVCNNSHTDKDYNIVSTTGFKGTILKGEDIIQSFLKTTVFDSSSACNKLYKCSVIKNNNIRFDETIKWGEDYPFNYYYFRIIDKMISIDDILYNYLMEREGSITDKVTSGSLSRWNLVKLSLLEEKNNETNYKIALSKFASELLCILRELLRTKNKELIAKHFNEIIDEIKTYSKEFLQITDISKINRLSIRLICLNPRLFKLFYSIYFKNKR